MEAGATGDDIARVRALVRSQLKYSSSNAKPMDPFLLPNFTKEMMETPYSTVRERQLKELEVEDDLMSKLPVRCDQWEF